MCPPNTCLLLLLCVQPVQCSWMFSRWENESTTSLFIPSHFAVIILSALNVRQRRGRHNKNSGRGALRPRLGVKPVILHLKWSCKQSQVVAAVDRLHRTNDMMKLWNKQVLMCCFLCVFVFVFEGPRRGKDTMEKERYSPMIQSVCKGEKWIYCMRHNCTLMRVSSIAGKLPLSASKHNKRDWCWSDGAQIFNKLLCESD